MLMKLAQKVYLSVLVHKNPCINTLVLRSSLSARDLLLWNALIPTLFEMLLEESSWRNL